MKKRGFTLIEIMIALMVSSLLIIGLTRLYSTMLNSYSLQEQLTEMNQNAKFTIKEISDVLMQAGADCGLVNSDTLEKDTIMTITNYKDFTIRVNPRGGTYAIPKDTVLKTSTGYLQVDNAYSFRLAAKIGHVPSISHSNVRVKTYTLTGIDTANNKLNISGVTSPDTFFKDDGVYSFIIHHYYRNGTNLCLDNDTNVLAENIDSLKVAFMDSTGSSTTNWKFMRSVELVVEATTSLSDYRYNVYSDHRRHLLLSYTFRLKNKV
jgi:prepilin-type N-terminal cleavage/methylation domain-containing protein